MQPVVELKKDKDGRVTRLAVCECGEPLYKKDLTNDRYEILRRDKGRVSVLGIETDSYCKFTCPNCGMGHKILTIKENLVFT